MLLPRAHAGLLSGNLCALPRLPLFFPSCLGGDTPWRSLMPVCGSLNCFAIANLYNAGQSACTASAASALASSS